MKIRNFVVGVVLLTLLLCGGLLLDFYHTVTSRQTIASTELTYKTAVFYREDCPSCRNILPQLWWHNLVKKDLVFVNMNQQKNRPYIQRYHLVEIPTLVKGQQQYTGTDKTKINQILGKDGN